MNSKKDYYAVLGVLSTAEDVVIAGAYRALAQRYHPDRLDGDQSDANTRMAEINEAYRILSDENLRAQFDRERDHSAESTGDMAFEFETFRPFAEKLREFGYEESKIREALVARGARLAVAERLTQSTS